MPTLKLTQAEISELLAKGAKFGPEVNLPQLDGLLISAEEPKETNLVSPGVSALGDNLTVFVPVKTVSEINGRDWRARSHRTQEARKAVSRTLGPHLDLLAPFALHYHDQKALAITFVRLGGKRLDASNLPTATKAVEDALAFMLGADDGDPRWHSFWAQEPEHDGVGVRIELEFYI